MYEKTLYEIFKENMKKYVEFNFFECKSCGCKGFECSEETKHEEKCLSKTVVFISKIKNNQRLEENIDLSQHQKLLFLYLIIFKYIYIFKILNYILYILI